MKIVAFDLETAIAAPDDPTASYALGITCAATAVADQSPILWHGEEQLGCYPKQMSADDCIDLARYLIEMVQAGYHIVAWNGLGFDFRVLAAHMPTQADYANVVDLALSHIDPAFQMLCQKGFMVGLDAAARGMDVGTKMAEMDGMKAVEMWPTVRANQEIVLEYVAQDARVTADTYRAIVKARRLSWISKRSGRANSWRPSISGGSRLLAVRECLALPEPDTSWMSDPWPRSKFAGWTGILDSV